MDCFNKAPSLMPAVAVMRANHPGTALGVPACPGRPKAPQAEARGESRGVGNLVFLSLRVGAEKGLAGGGVL